jgi:hypothetical protein
MIKYRWFPTGMPAALVTIQSAPGYIETAAGTAVIQENGRIELPFEAECQIWVDLGPREHGLRQMAICQCRKLQVWCQGTTVLIQLAPHGKLAVTFE